MTGARPRALPGEEVRGRGANETEEMIRFRLRRLVPFDAREARISYAFSSLADGEERVVVAAMSRAVVEEYEDAAVSLGLDAGIVDLSGLALQGAASMAPPTGDWLLVNWEQGYVSFILSRGSTPLLIRTLTEEAIPTRDGWLLLDQRASQIHILSAAGILTATFGRPGGPDDPQ